MTASGGSTRVIVVAVDEGDPQGPATIKEYSRRDVDAFNEAVVDALFAGRLECDDFALGFTACLDVLAGGRLDSFSPDNVVRVAYADVNDAYSDSWVLTDVLARACRRVADGRG